MTPDPLAPRIRELADELQAQSHAAHLLSPALANALLNLTVRLALLEHAAREDARALATVQAEAEQLRRDLRRAQNTANEALADMQDEAAIATRHARAQTITAILQPVLLPPPSEPTP